MKLYANKMMEEKLKKVDKKKEIFVKEELKTIIEKKGVYVLKHTYRGFDFDKLKVEKIQVEMSDNKIFLDDYYEGLTSTQKLETALGIMNEWVKVMKKNFPNDKFSIILSCDEEYVTIAFHKNRDDEEDWINERDLEGFIQPVMIAKVGRRGFS